LLPACVALVAHPDDERYVPLFGTTVRTPLFGVEVPVVAHPLAQPDKGTGIAMICTFGDLTDVIWWRELQLPTRAIISRDGRILADAPQGLDSPDGLARYAQLAGRSVKQAQTAIVEMLRETGDLVGDPRPIVHPVKFFEKGDRPLEIVTSRQWYIRNGGRDTGVRSGMLGRGRELRWHPDHMHHRYDNWVEGLNGDWLISRQRWFGVPVPVWYPLDADGNIVHDSPLVPDEALLPVDPSTDVPAGYDASQRGVPNGFVGDPDVMDTWATSSLTPQIAGRWCEDGDIFARVYPYDVRPQAHDIIRTWLFSTVVRSHFEHGTAPWANAALSGWILDPDRKKMSKSKGNVVTPIDLFDRYGSDAVRYWAACARPGIDTAFSEEQMKVGRKLATKLLNVTKFVLGAGGTGNGDEPTVAIDRAMLGRLSAVVEESTRALENYDYARALERTETFFWWFCDDYVELVKTRAYEADGGAATASARSALTRALSVMQRLLAPFLPFTTEEVWSWWQEGSVHTSAWPGAGDVDPGAGVGDHESFLDSACGTIAAIRRTKTEAKVSQKAAVSSVTVTAPPAVVDAVRDAWHDIAAAGSVDAVEFVEHGTELTVSVVLAPTA
ncbi:MAG: hypothetical protein RJB57_927, partial [Actinomycetota bacterium]